LMRIEDIRVGGVYVRLRRVNRKRFVRKVVNIRHNKAEDRQRVTFVDVKTGVHGSDSLSTFAQVMDYEVPAAHARTFKTPADLVDAMRRYFARPNVETDSILRRTILDAFSRDERRLLGTILLDLETGHGALTSVHREGLHEEALPLMRSIDVLQDRLRRVANHYGQLVCNVRIGGRVRAALPSGGTIVGWLKGFSITKGKPIRLYAYIECARSSRTRQVSAAKMRPAPCKVNSGNGTKPHREK